MTTLIRDRPVPEQPTLPIPHQLISGVVEQSAPLFFTANDCLDVGRSLGSPVALDYRERAPFVFSGEITKVHIAYT